ncbi:hypothetical protein [Segatella buccae]|uniref:hypothetical protein n=1 Tax=Segatella buccae TaxID=28126 RepID=UPI0028D6F26D|nr:hypothetical protein [Segatella buccae]
MKYREVSLSKMRDAIKACGMTEREFVKMYYGKQGSHGTLKGIIGVDFRISKLVKLCNMLDAKMDDLFDFEDDKGNLISPTIIGNSLNINSTVSTADNAVLLAENKTLRLLIEEKDKRISELQKIVDYVIHTPSTVGHVSDKEDKK